MTITITPVSQANLRCAVSHVTSWDVGYAGNNVYLMWVSKDYNEGADLIVNGSLLQMFGAAEKKGCIPKFLFELLN